MIYGSKTYESAYTTYQDDLRKVGISLNLRFLTPETRYQLVGDLKFDVAEVAWGGLTFPNPETSASSSLADQKNTNNITGVKEPRIDALLGPYDREFDQQKRVAIIREIDGILTGLHHYIMLWAPPYQRLAYWNKFGMPEGFLTRVGDHYDIPSLWWIDPAKQSELMRAMGDNTAKMAVGAVDVRYWEEYAKQHPFGTDVSGGAAK
jgi:microcin C transport system substrate-binding protein